MPRQPSIVPNQAAMAAASSGPSGNRPIDNPLTQPRFEAGRNSCSSGMSTAATPPTPKPTIRRMTTM